MDLTRITNNKLLEELSKRLLVNEICQQQINELNVSLHSVNQKLTESEAMKSHFISNISNEIINPFTSILAIADNILGVDKENWKKVIHMVAVMHTEVFNLNFQFKNIFAAAKLESGEIQPEISFVNIDKLIENVIQAFKYEAKHKHLKINYISENKIPRQTIYFKSDAEKLQLILSNLLSNAIKFSYTENEINIAAIKDGTKLTLSVQDFGQGISKVNEHIIFDRFKRLDDGINSINRGHGLGLSIIKSIIDILEGKIHFSSKEGQGTTFYTYYTESDQVTSGISYDADELFFKEETF